MPSLLQKLTAFVRSPQGRTVIDQARRQATKPEKPSPPRAAASPDDP